VLGFGELQSNIIHKKLELIMFLKMKMLFKLSKEFREIKTKKKNKERKRKEKEKKKLNF